MQLSGCCRFRWLVTMWRQYGPLPELAAVSLYKQIYRVLSYLVSSVLHLSPGLARGRAGRLPCAGAAQSGLPLHHAELLLPLPAPRPLVRLPRRVQRQAGALPARHQLLRTQGRTLTSRPDTRHCCRDCAELSVTLVQDCNRKEGQAGEFEHYKDTDVEPWWLVG